MVSGEFLRKERVSRLVYIEVLGWCIYTHCGIHCNYDVVANHCSVPEQCFFLFKFVCEVLE